VTWQETDVRRSPVSGFERSLVLRFETNPDDAIFAKLRQSADDAGTRQFHRNRWAHVCFSMQRFGVGNPYDADPQPSTREVLIERLPAAWLNVQTFLEQVAAIRPWVNKAAARATISALSTRGIVECRWSDPSRPQRCPMEIRRAESAAIGT
jgi:hypothetical protein